MGRVSGKEWASGALVGKFATVYTSTATVSLRNHARVTVD